MRCAWLGEGVLVLTAPPETGLEGLCAGPLRLDGDRDLAVVAAGPPSPDAVTDLETFVREELAPLPATLREQAVSMLSRLPALANAPPSLAGGLHTVREALRERWPLAVGDTERGLTIERLHRVAADEFYVVGAARAPVELASLTAVAPEGERIALLPDAFRCGEMFACHFRCAAPSVVEDGWVFEAVDVLGRGVEAPAALDIGSPATAIAADAALDAPDAESLRDAHLRPALARLQELRAGRVDVAALDVHGDAPEDPTVSVIVPLFFRIDLLEHQLAQFAGDAQLRACDLIYVCDSPESAEELRFRAAELYRLYELPFRVAVLSENGGISLARNAGARLASAEQLLFLDSDVLPGRPGWIADLCRAWEAAPGAGALGPKLLYEDGSVQHAGFDLEPPEPEPRLRGHHANAPATLAGGPVGAVSGSCLFTNADLFAAVGGMSSYYVQGGYEDVDYCCRVAEAGRDSIYAPEVTLYHLEAQSFPAELRAATDPFNRWLLSREWDR